jgi:MFS transporter, MHS family, citrate/tricarballylate:H+ symporter
MVNWLTQITGNTLAPAWYMVGGVALGLLAIVLMPETAPIKTGMRGV